MAKKGTGTENQATGTENQAGADAQGTETQTKVKKEKLFGSSLGLSEIRKREQKLTAKFNRLGRQVKGLKLSETSTSQILDILKAEYEVESKKVLTEPAAEEKKEESFV